MEAARKRKKLLIRFSANNAHPARRVTNSLFRKQCQQPCKQIITSSPDRGHVSSSVQAAPEHKIRVLPGECIAEIRKKSGIACSIRIQEAQKFRVCTLPGFLYRRTVSLVPFKDN
jgi:hypothetical protein